MLNADPNVGAIIQQVSDIKLVFRTRNIGRLAQATTLVLL
jgi:hypothetical protein